MSNKNIIPNGWIIEKLGNVSYINMGQSPPSSTYNEEGIGLPFFQGKTEFQSIYPYINKFCNAPLKIVNKDDVLISVRAPVGPTNLAPEKSAIGRGLAGIKSFSGMNSKFLLFHLRSIENKISDLGTGTTFKAISSSNLANISIYLPPINEQHRIVSKIEELFSELDNGVENLKLAQNQLKVYRQALLKHAFEGKLTEQWRKDNNPEPAEKLLERIKEERQNRYEQELKEWKLAIKEWEKEGKKGKKPAMSKKSRRIGKMIETEVSLLPDIPNEWKYTKLGNIGNLERGKSTHRPRNDKRLFGGNYPFIQTGEVRNSNIVIREYEKTYSEFGLQQSKLWKKGTLCITIAANIAETAFLGFDACFPDSVVGFIPENLTSDKFIFYFIEFSKIKIEEFAPATAQKNINLNILDNLYVPFCSKDEQIEVVNYLDSTFSLIDNLEKTIEKCFDKSKSIQHSILKKAFEGTLVNQNPDDEPASILLEQIKVEKKKYLEEQKKKTKPIKKENINMNGLLVLIESKFQDREFSYEELKNESSLSYEELKSQLFELLESGEKLASTFDKSVEIIKYKLVV